jgi:hypothetical protein
MHEMTERESIDYIAQLFMLEQDPDTPRSSIAMGPATAFVMIGALQLALRHPEFSEQHISMVREIIDQLRPLFDSTPGEFLLGLGNNPDYDVPHDCEHPFGPHARECPPGGHAGFKLEGR